LYPFFLRRLSCGRLGDKTPLKKRQWTLPMESPGKHGCSFSAEVLPGSRLPGVGEENQLAPLCQDYPRESQLSDGTTITLVWTAGTSPNPLLEAIPCEKERRCLLVTASLNLEGLAGRLGIGRLRGNTGPAYSWVLSADGSACTSGNQSCRAQRDR